MDFLVISDARMWEHVVVFGHHSAGCIHVICDADDFKATSKDTVDGMVCGRMLDTADHCSYIYGQISVQRGRTFHYRRCETRHEPSVD